jgi:hypothetical protein
VKHDVPLIQDDIALRVSVKALNDSVGMDGLIPTLLVFGTMPQLPTLQGKLSPYSGQEAREAAIKCASKEYRSYIAEQRIREALSAKISPGASLEYRPGDQVLVYREQTRLWEGPIYVVMHDGKVVTVQRDSGSAETQRFIVSSVKLYKAAITNPTSSRNADIPDDPSKEEIDDSPQNKQSEKGEERSKPDLDESNTERPPACRVMLTEVLAPDDPRGLTPKFLQAKMKELNDLKRNGAWK